MSLYRTDLSVNSTDTKVFAAITEPEHLVNWWPKRCSGTPENNAEYNFYFTPEYNWFGKVTEFIPEKSFHIKMTSSDEDWDPTSFGFDLKDTNPGEVLVRFSHTGWKECNAHFRRSSYCWAMLLHNLKNYIENGIIIPFDERE